MAALSIQVPYPVFYDRDGLPLDNGDIYIGTANTDALTNQIQVYYDEALTITASQPLKTSGGYIYRNGTPAQVYVNANDFSISVRESNGVLIYNFPTATGIGVGAASIEYDPPFTGAVTSGYTMQDKLAQYVSVKDFGAKGDGVTNDTAAIQACLDAFKSTAGFLPTKTRIIFFPTGTYLISSSLQVTSGQQLLGEGRTSLLKQTGGLTGQIIELAGIMPDDACNEVIVENLGFESTGSVWAIKATAGVVGQGLIKNIVFNCGYCLSLATYTQSTVVDTLLSVGPLNQLLHFKGNRNYIIHLDKEGSTGSSADPYILIEAHTSGKSNGIVIDDVLLEQTTSANKTMVKFDGVEKLEFLNYWAEPTLTNGYGLVIANCEFVHVGGYYQSPFSTNNRVKIENTRQVMFDFFDGDGEDVNLNSLLEIDSDSSIVIDSLRLRRYWDVVQATYPNIIVNQFVERTIGITAAHYTPVRPLWFGGNALQNPSFTAGVYGWSDFATGTGTTTTPASEINTGVMLNIDYGSSGIRVLGQQFTITAGMVGKPFTFSGWVKAVTGTGWVSVYMNGCGADSGNGGERAYVVDGWQFLTRSVVPQSAGTLTVGFYIVSLQTINLDDASFRSGQMSVPALEYSGSFDIAGKPVTFATAAPTTGTWPIGSKVFNSVPSVGAPKGWVCTVAGSPGTWVSEGNL